MNHLKPYLTSILEEEGLCDFSPCDNSPRLIEVMKQPAFKDPLRGNRLCCLVSELTTLAAVEFSSLRLALESDRKIERVGLPLSIRPQDIRLAIAKYDTTQTLRCRTAERILAGQFFAQDVFLFMGDLQKYDQLTGSNESLEAGLKQLPDRLKGELNPAATHLIDDLISGMWAEFEQLIWHLRLLVMIDATTQPSNQEEMRQAIRSFRDRWDPSSAPPYPPTIFPFRNRGGQGGAILPA